MEPLNTPEAMLLADFDRLEWRPAEGVIFLRRVLAEPQPSAELVRLSMAWLTLYYQELDDPIAECRAALADGLTPSEGASRLLRHLETLQ